MSAVWILATGEVIEVAPRNGATFQLDELQRFVGGYVEIVRLSDERLMFVDEEGKLKPAPVFNAVATALLGGVDPIVGDVLVCEPGQVE